LGPFSFAEIVTLAVVFAFFAIEVVVVGDSNGVAVDQCDSFDFFGHLRKLFQIDYRRLRQYADFRRGGIFKGFETGSGRWVVPPGVED
jgi:hypothetical protein